MLKYSIYSTALVDFVTLTLSHAEAQQEVQLLQL